MLSGLGDLSSLTIHLYVYFIDFLNVVYRFSFGGGSNEEKKIFIETVREEGR